MVALAAAPASRSEIGSAIGHKSITGSLRQALADLMAAGYTIQKKPNSRLQKYRLTLKAEKRRRGEKGSGGTSDSGKEPR